MALRHRPPSQQDSDEDDEHEVGTQVGLEPKRAAKSSQAKQMKRVKFEVEEAAVGQMQAPPEEPAGASDSAEDVFGSFLAKREQNIKANKAMVSWRGSRNI